MNTIFNVARLALAVMTLAAVAGCSSPPSDPERLIAKAQEYRQQGNSAAAMIAIKNILQKNPDHAEARYLLGADYLEAGDARSAEAELRRAVKLGTEPVRALPLLAKSLLSQGKFQQALDETDPARVPSAKDSPEMLNVRGAAHLFLGRPAESKQSLDQSLALRPENADALLGHARLAAREKKLDEAAKLIDRAIASSPKSVEAWAIKGDLARAIADQAGALAAYQKVLDLRPDHILARLAIASMQIASGNFDEAGKQINQMRKLAPNSPTATYLNALLEFRKKNYPAAREAVQQVLKVAPDYLPSMLLAGAIEYDFGSQGQAQLHLGRVIERVPDNLYARKLLLGSLAKSGQVQRAFEVLQIGLRQAPQDGGLLAFAGELHMQNNDLVKATQFFEKAAKLDPKNPETRTGLALSRLASGETEQGLADLESAVQMDSAKYQADVILVMSHLQRGNYDQALKALASLEKKQPDNPLTYNLKSSIYIGKKDTATARKYLERALELQPTYAAAVTNLAQLDLQDNKPQAARRRFEAILAKDKDNLQALLALASLGAAIGATEKEQIDWLERARKASPGSVQPNLMLAGLYARAGEAKKALEVAQQAQASSPDNAEVLNTLGTIQILAGEKNLALATYSKLVALQPKSPVALYHLAAAQVANADPTLAVSTLKKALALKPDFTDAQRSLVELEIRAGRFPEALKIAQQVQNQNPKSPLGFVLEGDVLMAQKKSAQAAKAYETGYGIGKSGLLTAKLHAAYTQAGKPDEADARIAQWLKESPDDAGARLYAAHANLISGKFKSAIEQYEWLLRKQPDNVVTLYHLAWAYQQVKDPRAMETVERAYKLKPDNAGVADTFGRMLVEQGNAKRGAELLQKAVAAAPNAPEIRYHLAEALAKSGDKTQAITHLERIVASRAKFPQEADAAALLKQLKN